MARVYRVRGAAAGRACGQWGGAGSVGGSLEELGWPSLEACGGSLPWPSSTRFTPAQCLLAGMGI